MQNRFIWMLTGLFFAGVAADFLITKLFSRTLAGGLVLMLAIGVPLCLLLRARLVECGVSPKWAWLGLLPMIGFPMGLVLYFYEPTENRQAG